MIEALRLDFLLWLGSGIPTGDVLRAARLGIWSYRHGEEPRYGAGRPGFWELVDRQPVVGVTLRRLGMPGDASPILRRGWFATAPGSYARTRDRIFLGPAAWPAQACRQALLGAPAVAAEPEKPVEVVRRPVSLGAFAGFLAILARGQLRTLWHHGWRHDDWNIGIVDAPVASFLDGDHVPTVAWAPTRRGRYAADPFGLLEGAALQVYFEDYGHASGRASIARRGWSPERGWGRPAAALEVGSHLSYPSLVEDGGRYLMLPESRASGALTLYASETHRGPWHRHATLDVDPDVSDATLLRHDGRWWLFAIRPDRLNPSTELGLWFADRPEGPWQEHPLSPVLVDPRSARPAGPPFRDGERLYRPAQDCSTGYGDRVTVKRIVRLTTEAFDEEAVAVVRPDPGGLFPHGLHTLTGIGPVTLVDGKRRVWSTAALVRTVMGRFRR
jgi:hypothetical protein